MTTPSTEQLLSLKPEDILIADNVRFGILPFRVDRLAEQILSDNGVNTPIEVQELSEPVDGKRWLLTAGEYRVTAVAKLNKEQNAGLTIPARVMPLENDTARLLRQISENRERENMSPMDTALAMQKLISAGLPTMEVRKTFAIAGGRKGRKIQPASNSYVNQTLKFLTLPKKIQNKIHDGTFGTGAAYDLLRYPAEKWDDILEREEKNRIAAIDLEEKDEEKYLKTQKEALELEVKIADEEKAIAEAQQAANEKAALAEAKAQELNDAFAANNVKGLDKAAKKLAEEHFKAAAAEKKAAEAAATKAAAELAKAKKNEEKIAATKERLEKLRNAAAAKAKAPAKAPAAAEKVSGKAIRKAASEVGATEKKVKLNANEMREACKTVSIMGAGQKTKLIGALLLQCFDGEITDGQLNQGIARVVGEEEMPKPAPSSKKK